MTIKFVAGMLLLSGKFPERKNRDIKPLLRSRWYKINR